MKISALIFTKNEESNISDCIKSLKVVNEIVIADDHSTDKTVEIAKSLGATVITRQDQFDTPTQQDVDDFSKRFGWKPTFVTKPEEDKTIKNKFFPAYKIPPKDSKNWTKVIRTLKNDWVIILCADERVKWNLFKIKKNILPIADQVECDFVHSHNTDGSPTSIAKRVYLFKKSITKWGGRTHNCTIPYGRIVYAPFFRVDHYQKPNAVVNGVEVHSQSYVLPVMEYSVLKEDDPRSRFYLGREYYYYKRYDEAIKLFKLYLEVATWQPEIQMAHIYLARCYWESQQGDKARVECLEAIRRNPDSKEALNLMSEMYFEPEKSKWKFIADNATNKDILF